MFENILYATNFSESPMMLPCVGIMGKTGKVHLLHVLDENIAIDPVLLEPQLAEAKQFMEDELNRQRHKRVEVDAHMVKGEPARAICDVAKRMNASLVVSTHTGSDPGVSTTQSLIKDCDRDLLVMTHFASDVVSRPGAVDPYCMDLFRKVLCVTDLSPDSVSQQMKALRTIKEESRLGNVILVSVGKDDDALDRMAKDVEDMGVHVEGWAIEGDPAHEIRASAEETNASIIIFNGDRDIDMVIDVGKGSDMPLLVLKGM